ncbi:cytochrome P450- family 706- subfamily A-polypeptide 4 [Striga hermonthica]|uniref:Cytochrome P450- family 706- subfamily A-polypeptide 4 n=1 Tax=Striga hermonthica TaxID=68872 RepID=A0A9N7R7G1_STRHE|nr:cytochrome P450- family 706- subfamily A-polypeptide 4 [Striga hermonthica]
MITTLPDAASPWWGPLTAAAAAAALAALYTLYLLLSKKPAGRPLPGPRGLPLVGNLLSLDPDLHTYFAGLARAHGPIFSLRLGFKTAVVVTSPSVAREMLKDHDAVFANRDVTEAGREATYGGRDIAWSPHGPEWRMLRKVSVREMLGSRALDSVYALRRREVRGTVRYLYGRRGSPVDVGEQMFVTLLNVITSMMWGETVVGEERARLGAEFKEVVGEIVGLLGMPNVSDFYQGWLGRLDVQGIRRRMRAAVGRMDRIFEAVVEQRLRGGGEGTGKDFLQFLLEMKDGEDVGFSMTHLKALLMDMVVGGTDTTSNTIEFALAEMMNKPEILARAQQEIDTVIGKQNTVEESHAKSLPYLHAVMKEALRLHPAVPLLVPHCPSTTCEVSGYTIPSGARVFFNVWAIHRDPSLWDNPLDFCPDRFLDGKWDYSGNDFSYFPFGSGRRICVGVDMAERMFVFSLATLVHSFDWRLPQGEKVDLSEKFGIVLKKKVPLVAIPTPRLSDPALYQ